MKPGGEIQFCFVCLALVFSGTQLFVQLLHANIFYIGVQRIGSKIVSEALSSVYILH